MGQGKSPNRGGFDVTGDYRKRSRELFRKDPLLNVGVFPAAAGQFGSGGQPLAAGMKCGQLP